MCASNSSIFVIVLIIIKITVCRGKGYNEKLLTIYKSEETYLYNNIKISKGKFFINLYLKKTGLILRNFFFF